MHTHETQSNAHYSEKDDNKRKETETRNSGLQDRSTANETLRPIHWDCIVRSKRIHSIGSFNQACLKPRCLLFMRSLTMRRRNTCCLSISAFQRTGSFLTPTQVQSCISQWEACSIHFPPEPLVVQIKALMVQQGTVHKKVST